ncbi:Hypothetical protein, putative [Bodo saltans]|uniref:Uncharacterized protein n=1 Tax=Bodo saltans TaxID=75058 RepID=A0A0S4JIQ0_BODSA|nr:Hypothetical protein, putative [Bodo saltans]|eukprot:CUG89120.1 Hypothetical protein, putative [Bodo saltans]
MLFFVKNTGVTSNNTLRSAVVAILFIGVTCDADVMLEPPCKAYCGSAGVFSRTLCNSYIAYGECLTLQFIGFNNVSSSFSLRGRNCTMPQCPDAGRTPSLSVGPVCYYGNSSSFNTASRLCPSGFYNADNATCYSNTGSSCPSGDALIDGFCHVPRIERCQNGYVRIDETERCLGGIPPTTIMSASQCGYANTSTIHCEWCSAINVCLPKGDICSKNCSTAPYSQCTLPPSYCHWCPQHNGRCKPHNAAGYVAWRNEVECISGSTTSSHSVAASRTKGTLSYSSSMSRPNISLSETIHSSTSQSISQHLSTGTTPLTASRTQSPTSLSTFTMTVWSSTTLSTTFTTDASLTFSYDNSSRSITSTYASRSLLPSTTTTHSNHTSWSTTRSKTSGLSISVMMLPSSSMEISQPSKTYLTSTGDISQEMSHSVSPSTTTTASLQLAPCGLRHVDVIRSMVPPLFQLTMNLTRFKESSTDVLHINDNLSITDRLPLILRHEHFSRPVINYAHPTPYQTPNIDGFVNRGGTNVTLRWVNVSALELTLPSIPNYWIDADEDATVDVPFEELQLCNRTDPASVNVPETVPLVSVHVVGPLVTTPSSRLRSRCRSLRTSAECCRVMHLPRRRCRRWWCWACSRAGSQRCAKR